MGLRGTERQAQRAYERQVLTQIVALAEPDGTVPAEQVEQALGYFREATPGNPAQQVLGRRLRAAIDGLYAQGSLDTTALGGSYRPTAAGRAAVSAGRRPWWRRALATARAR